MCQQVLILVWAPLHQWFALLVLINRAQEVHLASLHQQVVMFQLLVQQVQHYVRRERTIQIQEALMRVPACKRQQVFTLLQVHHHQ